MRNRPIRHGGLVSEVGYSSSTCRIQQEYQVGVLGRTNGMMLVVSLPTKEMLHLEMNKNLLFSQDQFARAQAVLDEWLPFLCSLMAFLRRALTLTGTFASFSLNLTEPWTAGKLLDWDTSTRSVINMDFAKEWYWEYKRDHPECHKSATPLPIRVIDISNLDEGGEPILYETLPGTTGDYIALSYC